jgi:hypothetical protein
MMIGCLMTRFPNLTMRYELGRLLGARNLGKLLREKQRWKSDTRYATTGNPIDGGDHARGQGHTSAYLDVFGFRRQQRIQIDLFQMRCSYRVVEQPHSYFRTIMQSVRFVRSCES